MHLEGQLNGIQQCVQNRVHNCKAMNKTLLLLCKDPAWLLFRNFGAPLKVPAAWESKEQIEMSTGSRSEFREHKIHVRQNPK